MPAPVAMAVPASGPASVPVRAPAAARALPPPNLETDGALQFDADACAIASGSLAHGLGSVSVEILGRDDRGCRFRFTDELEGSYEILECHIGQGRVEIVADPRKRPTSALALDPALPFVPTRDCALERDGWVGDDRGNARPLIAETGATVNGKRTGVWIAWRDGAMRLASTTSYRDGIKDGEEVVYLAFPHSVERRGAYRDGQKEGPWTEPSPASFGSTDHGRYAHDERSGVWITRGLGGRVTMSTTYRAGRKHGAYAARYDAGRLREQGEYLDGEKSGTWRTWDPAGVLLDELRYRRGQLDGPQKRYSDRTRTLIELDEFVEGVPHGRFRAWSETGALRTEIRYEHGVKIDGDAGLPARGAAGPVGR